MARIKRQTKAPTGRFNIRLDEETALFYRRKAQQNGITLSEYLRQTLVQGVIANNVEEIEMRLKEAAIHSPAASLPDEALLSLFTSEALLTILAESRDLQQVYEAQNRAQARLSRLKDIND